MNRNEFKKLLPTEEEINTKTEKIFIGKSIKTVLHERYYQKGFRDALEYLTAKFPDFTEHEKVKSKSHKFTRAETKAIEIWQSDKVEAIRFLMESKGIDFWAAREFLLDATYM